jgi:hypothetical protein
MKVIKITKCFDECPHCTGPDLNRKTGVWRYTCQEIPEWLDNEDIIPDWCPLNDVNQKEVRMIDRKFKFVATNPCKGNVYTEENAIVFLAKDRAVPKMLVAYKDECRAIGCADNHIQSIDLLLDRVLEFQTETESRVPDTEGECEVNRCIHGEV